VSKKSILLGFLVLGSFGQLLSAVEAGGDEEILQTGSVVIPGLDQQSVQGITYQEFVAIIDAHLNAYKASEASENLGVWLARHLVLTEQFLTIGSCWDAAHKRAVILQLCFGQSYLTTLLSDKRAGDVTDLVRMMGKVQLLLTPVAVAAAEATFDLKDLKKFFEFFWFTHFNVAWCITAQPVGLITTEVERLIQQQYEFLPRVGQIINQFEPREAGEIVKSLCRAHDCVVVCGCRQQKRNFKRLVDMQFLLLDHVSRVVGDVSSEQACETMQRVADAHGNITKAFMKWMDSKKISFGLVQQLGVIQDRLATDTMKLLQFVNGDQSKKLMKAMRDMEAILVQNCGVPKGLVMDVIEEEC
jgi:hypothetical protein